MESKTRQQHKNRAHRCREQVGHYQRQGTGRGLGAGRECVENFLLFFEIENLTSENKKGGKTTTTPAESESRSVTSDSATPWSIQYIEFSRPEYWSG